MLAPWPAAGSTLALLQLFLGPTNAACSGHLLLGILDPADELIAGQRSDVLPGIECRGVGDQRLTQVSWKLVHDPARHSQAAHSATVTIMRATDPEMMLRWRGALDPQLSVVGGEERRRGPAISSGGGPRDQGIRAVRATC